MDFSIITDNLKDKLQSVFDEVDSIFDWDVNVLAYCPASGGWTVAEILEHIALTNKYLLILIDKGAQKALKNVQERDFEEFVKDYRLLKEGLEEVALYKSFSWMRPEHMEPKGETLLSEVRIWMKNQLKQCFSILEQLPNGEGILYQTTMSVNNLGKLDVYQYLYFLAMHALRHCVQMEANRTEMNR